MEFTESSSSDEANIDALVNEVDKLNDDKTNIRRKLEALTIRMSQEFEERRTTKDIIKDKDHEILKMNQEIGNLHAQLHEEKEEIQDDLDMAMSLRESFRKKNEELTKEMADANEILAKFNKSTAMIDE